MSDKLVQAFVGMVGAALKGDAAVQAANIAVMVLETKALASAEEQSALADAVKVLRCGEEKIKADLKEITAPLDKARAAATALARKSLDPIANAIAKAKSLDGAYRERMDREAAERVRVERARALASAKAAADAAWGEGYAAPPVAIETVMPPPSVVRGGVGGSHVRRTPKAQAFDVARLAAHPDYAYLLELSAGKAIAEYRTRAAQAGEERAIAEFEAAGIRITFETSTVFT